MIDDETRERLIQAITGAEIDKYIHRELSHFGASNIVDALLPFLTEVDMSTLTPPKTSSTYTPNPLLSKEMNGILAKTSKAGIPAGYEEYDWVERKCSDAFCNKYNGHPGYCDNDVLPNKPWERKRKGIRQISTPTPTIPATKPNPTLKEKIIEWSVSTVSGETHADKVDRLMPTIANAVEAEWDSGYERAESDADAAGFYSKRFRANPHRGVKPA